MSTSTTIIALLFLGAAIITGMSVVPQVLEDFFREVKAILNAEEDD